tara:strand:+ start:6149 stop:7234 length:1086 start_codon:yes stop_codon:yes gene_type:complete
MNKKIQTKYYPSDELIVAEYNPRQLTKDQYSQLKDSVKRFGLVDPLIVNTHKDRKNILVGGHQRLRISKDLGINKIPCVEVNLTYDQERELNIRLNKNTGEWDYDTLANNFDSEDLVDWGFSDDELVGFAPDEDKEGNIDDDEIPEVEEAVTKLGDLWILGEHRLLCGDVLKDMDKLPNDYSSIVTDPPYGMDAVKNSGVLKDKYKDIKNDNDNNVAKESYKILNKNIPQVWFGANYYSSVLPDSASWFVWDKNNGGSDQMDCELAWSNLKGVVRKYKQASEKKNRFHPTQKPVDLFLWVLKKIDSKIVLDPFLGSGSTLIACEKTNRKCYGMELDPHYCDVIVKRWEEFTGKKAELYESE